MDRHNNSSSKLLIISIFAGGNGAFLECSRWQDVASWYGKMLRPISINKLPALLGMECKKKKELGTYTEARQYIV